MLITEREKLLQRTSEYLSIGITEDGSPRSVVGVPWEMTATAFNMRIPDIYLSPEDLTDDTLMAEISGYRVIGCYIYAPLLDYSFLSRFTELQDLSISRGDSIRDLSFLEGLSECRMLFLQNAKLENLDVLLDEKSHCKSSVFGCYKCVALHGCEVKDISRLERERFFFTEFLVWGTASDRERWKVVSAGKARYFSMED